MGNVLAVDLHDPEPHGLDQPVPQDLLADEVLAVLVVVLRDPDQDHHDLVVLRQSAKPATFYLVKPSFNEAIYLAGDQKYEVPQFNCLRGNIEHRDIHQNLR